MTPMDTPKPDRYSGLPRNDFIDMHDGARWRHFDIKGGNVILTSSGNDLIKNNGLLGLLDLVNQYRRETRNKGRDGNVRRYFINGGNGTIYHLGDTEIVVKESYSGQSLYSALRRLDNLSYVIETTLPHWVQVVEHYAYVSYQGAKSEYVAMRKIDGGVSIQDLIMYASGESPRFQFLEKEIKDNFSGFTKSDLEEILKQKAEFEKTISQYCEEHDMKLSDILPDPNSANYLVTPLTTPVGGKRFKLWIIDQ
jgi:hypothetical protein